MDQLNEYITAARKKGKKDEEIKQSLIHAGWNSSLVTTALSGDDLPPPPPPSPASSTGSSVSPSAHPSSTWDAFEHILLFISLYVMATSIALIIHFFIDKFVPGITTSLYGRSSFQTTMLNGYLAALIVSLPLFSFFFLHIAKRTLANPSIRLLHSRKLLIYMTLVGTFIIMIFNVIRIVYELLNGNITINFLLHIINTLVISGIVFLYYLYQVREDRKSNV